MAGLFEKDLRLILKRKQFLVVFLAIAIMMGVNADGSFVVGYLTCLCTVFTVSTISYDEMENGYPFLMTLPIDSKTYVYEKYLFCLVLGGAAWILSIGMLFGIQAIKGVPVNPVEEIVNSVAILPVCMLFGAVLIPLQLKFGAEKSRIALGALFGIVFCFLLTAREMAEKAGVDVAEKVARLDEMPLGVILAILIGVSIAVVGISVACSVRIMDKKEY